MNNQHIVKKQITISATPKEVWRALTDPEMTKKYFYKSEVHSSWKVGSPISFKMKMLGVPMELKGKIEKIEPEKLLQYTLVNSKLIGKPDPSHHSLVTDVLTYENGKTTVSITDDVGDYEGAEKRYERSVKGWDKILNGLKEVVEGKA